MALARCAFSNSILLAALALSLAGFFSGCQSDKATREETKRAVLSGDKGITIYAAGDIADCRNREPAQTGAAKTAALIASGLAADKNAAVLTLGDHTYPVGLLSEFSDCYEPTWGKFKARTYPTPGNHEYYTPYAAGYYTYFGDAAGPGRNGYYSFRLGDWHIISLNSYLNPDEHRKQLEWLQADLAQNKSRCTLAFWHHPRYSSGGHGDNPQMDDTWQMLNAAGAELVLSSHDHNYERFAPQNRNGERDDRNGIRQFVVGNGGARLTPLRFRNANSVVSDNSTHGVLKLILRENGYEWEFLPVDKGGFTDSGATLCH